MLKDLTVKERLATDWIVPTLDVVATFFGVHPDTPRAWRTGADPMPGAPGRWDLSAIAQWRARRTERTGLGEELRAAEIRLKTAQARAKELENSLAEGELLDRSDVELWAATALIKARQIVMSLPEKIATSAPPDIREVARTEADLTCRAALASLRRDLESDELSHGGDTNHEP